MLDHNSVQINGIEETIFKCVTFSVSDKQYKKIKEAIRKGIPLKDCDFIDHLESCALCEIDLEEMIHIDIDQPDRDDYDNEEEYNEAVEKYEEEIFNIRDCYFIVNVTVDDPGGIPRLLKEIQCLRFSKWSGQTISLEYEYCDEIYATYTITLAVDENGIVTDILSAGGSGMESDGLKSSRWGEIYPDFDYIKKRLIKDADKQG